jgi:hypothetical protein
MRLAVAASPVVVVLCTVVLAGCDRPANSGGPQSFSFVPSAATATPTALIHPASLPVIPTPIGTPCAGGLPLSTSLNLIVTASASPLLLDQVALQVFGVNNVGAPPTVLTGTSLTGMFGSLVIPAGTTRTFALSPQFGCVAVPASLTAVLVLTGPAGTSQMTLNAPFAK